MAKQNPKPKTAPEQIQPAPPVRAGAPDAPPEQDNEGHARTVRVKPVLRVSAKREGFRRAGHAFGYLPRDIVLDSLTEDQIEQIKADPMLTCVDVEVEAAGE